MSLTHGPLLGFGNDIFTGIKAWCRGDANETYEIRYSVNSDMSNSTITSSGQSLNIAVNDGANSIEITELTSGVKYYYTPVIGGVDELVSNFPSFRPLPVSPIGETIVFGSCISEKETVVNPHLCSSPPVNLLNYAKDTLQASAIFLMGDTIYGEDSTSVWDRDINSSIPPVSHFEERFKLTYAIAAVKNCLGSLPSVQLPSDHDVYGGWPDDSAGGDSYSHPAAPDDPTTAEAYPNSKTARGYYVENFALSPNAVGGNLYGSFTWGDCEIITLDTRTHRHSNKGKCLGETQKAWLLNILATLTAKQTALIMTGDSFAIDTGLNGDGWESDDSTLPVGYIAERDQIDSAANRSKAKVHFFGGDRHHGARGTTKGGNLAITTGPFEDSLQRGFGSSIERVIKSEDWSNDESPNIEDNRMCAITFNADNTMTFNHYRAGEGAGGADEDVIVLDDTVTI